MSRAAAQPAGRSVPILVFHPFAGQAVDAMTVRTETLRAHLRVFEETGYQIVLPAQVLAWQAGGPDTLPPRAVVLTVVDGHRSVYWASCSTRCRNCAAKLMLC